MRVCLGPDCKIREERPFPFICSTCKQSAAWQQGESTFTGLGGYYFTPREEH